MKMNSKLLTGIFVILSFCCVFSTTAENVFFKSVVLPAVPTPAEKTAAGELVLHLEQFGKNKLKIVTENKYYAVPAIFIGNTEYSLKSKSRCTFSGQDAWRIRRHDGNLIISGTAPAGVLYGVYEFLEKYCGVFWLDLYYTSFPENKTISLSEKLDDSGKPAFAWRGIFTTFNEAPGRVKFLVRNRENIFFEDTVARRELARWGLKQIFGSPGCQDTLWKYIREWPAAGWEECYSLNLNKRRVRPTGNAGPGQVCYTNQKARKKFAAQLEEFIANDRRRQPENPPFIYCIIQNDVAERCECAVCLASAKKYGAYSGVLLEFVNDIAGRIKKRYPDVIIQTDAYMNTEKPPVSGICASDNVRVRFTPYSWVKNKYDMMRPLSACERADYCKKWSSIARIHVWDYWVLFGASAGNNAGVIPQNAIVENHKLYKKCGSEYVFSECEYPDRTNFHALRVWMGYKIKLDPEQPVEPLLKTFFNNYYKQAAVPMQQLYDLILSKQSQSPHLNEIAVNNRTYLDEDFFVQAEKLLDSAEKAVVHDPELLCHVTNERVVVDIARLRRFGQNKSLPSPAVVKARLRKNWTKSIKRWYAGDREKRNFAVMENFFSSMQKMSSGLKYPLQLKIKADTVFDITWQDFNVKPLASYGTQIVSDPEAAGNKAVEISLTKRNIDPAKFHAKNAKSLRFAVYSDSQKKNLAESVLRKHKIPQDEKYHFYKIGTAALDQSCMIWTADWLIQHKLDKLFVHGEKSNYTFWISLKLQGPAYVKGSKLHNAVRCDRIIAIPCP